MEIHLHGLTESQRYKAQAGELSYTIRETIPPQLLGCPRENQSPSTVGWQQAVTACSGCVFSSWQLCGWAQKYCLVSWDRRLALFCLLLLKQQLTDLCLSLAHGWLPQQIALSQQRGWVDWLSVDSTDLWSLGQRKCWLWRHLYLVRWILPDFLKVFKFVSVLN